MEAFTELAVLTQSFQTTAKVLAVTEDKPSNLTLRLNQISLEVVGYNHLGKTVDPNKNGREFLIKEFYFCRS